MKKTLNLNLDYGFKDVEESSADEQSRYITSTIFKTAFRRNYEQSGMGRDISVVYRSIMMEVEEAVQEGQDLVTLAKSEFDTLYKEVDRCKFPPDLAVFAPVVYDELDTVKNRKEDEEKALIQEVG